MATVEERFWLKVDRSAGTDGCWPWLAACETWGYGIFSLEGRSVRAHRFAWTLIHGPIPDGLCVLHRCDNPPCCNVERCHFLGTNVDNVADRDAKGRTARGDTSGRRRHPTSYRNLPPPPRVCGDDHWMRKYPERVKEIVKPPPPQIGVLNAHAKLTERAVREMRRLYATGNTSYPKLARQFGVNVATTYNAVVGITWKHVL